MSSSAYQHLLHQLYSIALHRGVKLGLQTVQHLSELLHSPQNSFSTIHIAGTNGKGSTSTKIAAGLQAAGYRIGLYTSPHISSFRERIRCQGEMIDEESVTHHLENIFSLTQQQNIQPTFFEYVTLLALSYFAEKKVDIAVLETGLGGRLDATNIVDPILSVITSIDLEHTAILGETIEEITKEKAGIIKPKRPLIIGPTVPYSVIAPIANSLDSPVYQIKGNQFANFEEENCAIAQKALELLSVPNKAIQIGLQALPPCRYEEVPLQLLENHFLQFPKKVILDVAHNPNGLEQLFKRLQSFHGPLYVVYGGSRDKDLKGCLRQIVPHAKQLYFVQAASPRAALVTELVALAHELNPSHSHIYGSVSIEEAVHQAIVQAAQEEAVVIICGTFFIMGAVRSYLGYNESKDTYDVCV